MTKRDGRSIAWTLGLLAAALSASCGDGDVGAEPRTFTIQLPSTGQITSHAAGDDGATRRGAAWPSPRFTNPDGTVPVSGEMVLDRMTGLFWTRDAHAPGPAACGPGRRMNWTAALAYVSCLNANQHLGFADWHLPNRVELSSLLNYEPADWQAWMAAQGFSNVMTSYWSSSTPYDDTPIHQVRWAVWIAATAYRNAADDLYVWPVRGATSVLPRTSQTRSYAAGDDADVQIGAAWPEPRFTRRDDTSGVLLDELTGLMWTRDASVPGPDACEPGVQKSWAGALAYVDCLNAHNHLGYSDWVLPNVNELESLLIYKGSFGPFHWLNDRGFSSVRAAGYWSSTADAAAPLPFAWVIVMLDGHRGAAEKRNLAWVWPVRQWRQEPPALRGPG